MGPDCIDHWRYIKGKRLHTNNIIMSGDNDKPIGVAVAGLGIAGKFRIRDLKVCQKYDSMKRLKLMGFVSRRTLEIEDVKQMTLDEVTSNPDIHMVIISTESNLHEEMAKKCILAKKHVCIEFPMTLNATTTKELLKLAQENGVVCYEEDVALLGPPYLQLQKDLSGKLDQLKEAEMELTGRYNGWVEDFERAGTPSTSSIDNLHNLLDLLGDLTPVEAFITRTNDEIVAEAKLLTTKGVRPLKLRAVRRKTIERRGKIFTATFNDGTKLESILSAPSKLDKGVYMTDLEMFTETVLGMRNNEHQEWLCVRGLEIADQLNSMAKQNPASINYS